MSDLPISIGSSGLVGRPQVRPPNEDFVEPINYEEDGTPVYAQEPAKGNAIPGSCLRVLNSPLSIDRGGGCAHDCVGQQRDGSCLADLVRKCNEASIAWSFEVDRDGYWTYIGQPLPSDT